MSRTKTILSNKDLIQIKRLIESNLSKTKINQKSIYIAPIGRPNNEGEIIEKQKGQISAYFWGMKTNRGYIGLNLQIINGYQDPLFNDEGKVKIYYEIFPSATLNPRDSKIFDTFKQEQNTISASDSSSTKKVVRKILKKFKSRR